MFDALSGSKRLAVVIVAIALACSPSPTPALTPAPTPLPSPAAPTLLPSPSAPTPLPSPTSPAGGASLDCEAPARIPCEDRVVRRSVGIPGTGLSLQYASDRVPGPSGQGFDARVLGLGGWTLDVLDVYEPARRRLLPGREPSREVEAVAPAEGPAAGSLLIASPDALEVAEFDPTGRQVATRDALTGAVLRRFAYDADGRLTSVNDSASGKVTIERDARGAPEAIVGPTGLRTQVRVTVDGYLDRIVAHARPPTLLTVGAGGLVTELIDAAGERHQFEYDVRGLLTRYTDPAGGATSLGPLAAPGAGVVVTSPLGRTWTYRSERQPDGSFHRTVAGPAGDTTDLVIAPDGAVTIVYPSGLRRVERRTADPRWGRQSPAMASIELSTPAGLRWQQTASLTATLENASDPFSLSTLTAERNAGRSSFRRTFDAASRTLVTTGPDGRMDRLALDGAGRIVSSQRGDLAALQYTYDEQGRLASIAADDPAARGFTWTYEDGPGLVSVRNPLGQVARVQYDAGGAPSWYAAGDGAAVSLRTDGLGRLASISPPGHAAYGLRRSTTGIVTTLDPPAPEGANASAPLAPSLDADGWLTRLSGPAGTGAVLAYDEAGRLTQVGTGDGTVTAAYEGASTRLRSLTGPGGETLSYSWDGPLMVGETWAGPVAGSVLRTFDDTFRVVRQVVNGASEVTFAYDNRARTVSAGALALEYGALERPARARLGDLVETWAYDEAGLPVSTRVTVGGRVVYEEADERDALGRVTRQTTRLDASVVDIQFGYDAAGRLASAQRDANTTLYGYDLAGNRVTMAGSTGSVASTFDGLDRLLSMGGTRYSHDDAGNLVRAEAPDGPTLYRYDTLGRLLGVDLPGSRHVEYVLDGLGRRVGVRVDGALLRGFLYADELRPIAELDGSGGVVSRFVYSAAGRAPEYLVRDGRTYALVADQLGSVRAAVDTATGAIAQRIEYDPFGRVLADTAPGFQPFGFAGGLADPLTGLVHLGAREYDPRTGRFTTPDPLDFAGGDTNLYRYAFGDPVNRIDPTGASDPAGGDEPTIGDPDPTDSPNTGGISFGGGFGVGSHQYSFGWNAQYFPGNDWAIYNYVPAKDEPGSGFSFGVDLSVNFGWHQGEPPDDPEGSWEGVFKSRGAGVGPVSMETYKSSPEKPGWSGLDIGLGIGSPGAFYTKATDYQCTIGCGAATGDPHVLTGDGLSFEFQAAGEFVAVDGGAGDLGIQIRTEPYGTSTVVSIVTAVALDVGGDRVSFYASDATEVHVAGQPARVTVPIALPHGGRLDRIDGGYRVTWPDSSRVDVAAYLGRALDLTVDLASPRANTVHGLLGDQDDVSANDLATRDGRVLSLPGLRDPQYAEVVYGTFAESWRVTAGESLFDYQPGATTATYTRRDFPARVVAPDTLSPDVRASAEMICRRAGVNAPPFLDACIIDVGLTADAGFATSAARGQGQTIPPAPTRAYPIEMGEFVGPDRPFEGAGRVGAPEEVDEYPFAVEAGRNWYLAASPKCADGGLRWRLIGPDGAPIRNTLGAVDEPVCRDLGRFTAASTGTYTVQVRAGAGTAATGDYGFQVIPVQADVRTTIAIGDKVGPDNPLPGAGRLSVPGAVHRFLFTAAAGDAVYLGTAGCAQGTVVWRLFGADDKPVIGYRQQTCLDLGRFDVPSAGAYTVVVGEGGPETGTYGFTLVRVGPDGAFAVQPGDVIAVDRPGPGAGRIETPGSVDRYTFAATAGDRISVENLVSGAASCSDLRWDLIAATGSALYADQILCAGAERPAIAAPSSGTYTLRVRGAGAKIGTYGMRVTATR